ncbi:myxochelin B biosynthesis transaminase MxcL [Jeongeupia naejangsanensis]|uniref:Myxochelin B biosynthesis transaminase MxcL n=1 Tax=Jeongeupia naejangsanensis TaxID=613195 RepID=A0ABS2BGZ4_9NEIS|nr:myxochelin B biosynthesis transaminase MxcL [Jeongeupia naejangsanensis]MBM3114882.1 myxochelin B biosynthesis transaminase MxcL [Jeongeupia naejangsanensis]
METVASKPTTLPRAITGPLNIERSMQMLEAARKLIPGVTQSMMKRPEMFALGEFPVYLAGGQGALVDDVDGNQYLDMICGLAANTLGHNHPAVVGAIQSHLAKGVLHSLPTEVEISATLALVEIIPNAEMARFFKTGADATSAAVRLSRHITGREHIITVGYNGWHDHFQFDTPGVPKAVADNTTRMPLFTPPDEPALLAKIAELGDKLACVLLSVPYNRVLSREFVQEVRAACTANGTLFILDEVVTGFRLALGGAQEFFGVDADMVCLSKGIAAGMPLSAIAGPERHLRRLDELQVSTTFGGEVLSLAVCEAVIGVYRETDYVARIAELGRRLRAGVNAAAEAAGAPLRIYGYDPIPLFLMAKDPAEHVKLMQPFQAAMARRGVLLRRDVNFICGAHTEEQIDFVIAAVADALRELQQKGVFSS